MKNKYLVAIVTILIITGCSKKENAESSADSSTHSNEIVQQTADTAKSADNLENQPNTSPASAQKPDVILNPQINQVEAARKMVREAKVDFTAKDVVKAALDIDKLTYEAGGFIEQKNIDFTVVDSHSNKIGDGKVKVFEKVNPSADIIVRIPSEKAAVYVNQLLPLMFFLNQQQYSAKRYELKLLEEKISQNQTVFNSTKRPEMNEIARLTDLEVQDRVKFSTIAIHISQPITVRERYDVDIDTVARLNGDSFWKRAWDGVQYGWQFVLDLLIILVTIWPLYLIIVIGILLYKFIRPILNKLLK